MGQDGLLMKILYIESNAEQSRGEGTTGFAAASTCINTPAHSRYDSSASAMEGPLSIGDGE